MGALGNMILFGLLAVVGVATFRALFMYKTLPPPTTCLDLHNHKRISLKSDPRILQRFMGALNIPSISYKMHEYDGPQMLNLINYIENNYPNIHKSSFIKREIVSNYSLLYTVQGSNPKLRPYMLTSHLDVVPAVRSKWSSEPFEAVVKPDGYIYARGTMDAKHLTIGILEATEFLLQNNFRPQRTYFMAFGHDEEVLGLEGAQEIARILAERTKAYDKMEYIIDEGLIISKTRFPGIPHNIGLIGVSEKGYMSLRVSTVGDVGHGSMPPQRTAISKLANVVGRFHSNMLPSFLGRGVEREMFEIFAAHSTWPMKFVYANFWLFKPILGYVFSQNPTLNALIRTTTAVTMIDGGTKENVLPDSAYAIINHRLHQAQTIEEVIEYDRKLINDPTVDLRLNSPATPADPVSPYCDSCYGYQLIKQSLLQIYPGTVVVPSIFLAATDSKWYKNLTDSIYRFSAIAVELDEMKCFHGHDERLSIENYESLLNFYHHLIINSDKAKLDFSPKQRDEL